MSYALLDLYKKIYIWALGIQKYYQEEQTNRWYSKYMENYESIIKINNKTEGEVQNIASIIFLWNLHLQAAI